jgi:hypothetical protein
MTGECLDQMAIWSRERTLSSDKAKDTHQIAFASHEPREREIITAKLLGKRSSDNLAGASDAHGLHSFPTHSRKSLR